MSKIPRFAAYAAAFEKAYANDDWSLVEPFFTEDAVYDSGLGPPFGGTVTGRAAILAYFGEVVNRFDRRFASREVALLEGPKQDGDSVWIRGSATYRAPGAPDFVLLLEETARFDGDRISRLEDHYAPSMVEAIHAYLKSHGAGLGIRAD
jgi:hypothetical protein